MTMINIAIVYNNIELARSIKRYLKFFMGFRTVSIATLKEPFRKRETYEMVLNSDLLIEDVFAAEKSGEFQFAKVMEKKTLLLFYAGGIDIETEGPFWLVMPGGLKKLPGKITDILSRSVPSIEAFLELEIRFPILKEEKNHHRSHQ